MLTKFSCSFPVNGNFPLKQRWKKYFSFSVSYIDQKLSPKKNPSLFLSIFIVCELLKLLTEKSDLTNYRVAQLCWSINYKAKQFPECYDSHFWRCSIPQGEPYKLFDKNQ